MTDTAQVISGLISNSDPKAISAGLSLACGVIISHLYEPLSEKIQMVPWLKPWIPSFACFGAAAIATLQNGGDWKTSGANGMIALAAAYMNHTIAFAPKNV